MLPGEKTRENKTSSLVVTARRRCGAGGAAAGAASVVAMVQSMQRIGASASIMPVSVDPGTRALATGMASVFNMSSWATPLDDAASELDEGAAISDAEPKGTEAEGPVAGAGAARRSALGAALATATLCACPGRRGWEFKEQAGGVPCAAGWEVVTEQDVSMTLSNAARRALRPGDGPHGGEGWGEAEQETDMQDLLAGTSSAAQASRRLLWAAVILAAASAIRAIAARASVLRRRRRGERNATPPPWLEPPKVEATVGVLLLPLVAESAGFLLGGQAAGLAVAVALLTLSGAVVASLAFAILAGQAFAAPEQRDVAYVVDDEELRSYRDLLARSGRWKALSWLGVGRVMPRGRWVARSEQGALALRRYGVLFEHVAGPPVVRVGASYELIGRVRLPTAGDGKAARGVPSKAGDVEEARGALKGGAFATVEVPRFDRGVLVPLVDVIYDPKSDGRALRWGRAR